MAYLSPDRRTRIHPGDGRLASAACLDTWNSQSRKERGGEKGEGERKKRERSGFLCLLPQLHASAPFHNSFPCSAETLLQKTALSKFGFPKALSGTVFLLLLFFLFHSLSIQEEAVFL